MPLLSLASRRSTPASPPPVARAPQPTPLVPVGQAHDAAGNQAIQAALAGQGDPRLVERMIRAIAGIPEPQAGVALPATARRPTPARPLDGLATALGADRFFGAA